jgi:Flp pilus assembly protein TadB
MEGLEVAVKAAVETADVCRRGDSVMKRARNAVISIVLVALGVAAAELVRDSFGPVAYWVSVAVLLLLFLPLWLCASSVRRRASQEEQAASRAMGREKERGA